MPEMWRQEGLARCGLSKVPRLQPEHKGAGALQAMPSLWRPVSEKDREADGEILYYSLLVRMDQTTSRASHLGGGEVRSDAGVESRDGGIRRAKVQA